MKDIDYTYLLEQKGTQLWVTVTGELTNKPSEALPFKYRHTAEDWLQQLSVEWTSDYSGQTKTQDPGRNFAIGIQTMVREKLAKDGIDLFKDFIVTEHQF